MLTGNRWLKMKYVTGQHALNLTCALFTCGDWRQSAIQWHSPLFRDCEDSVFGDYGIEQEKPIPGHAENYRVANHIRALLDLLELGRFSLAQGMNKDFICNDDYTEDIFRQVTKLKDSSLWHDIDRFMGKEYCAEWLDYKKRSGCA